jgi:nucleoside-diphosphate-sugar epimerase
MKQKVVILGNSGFIGSSLERDLREVGGIQVEGLNSSDLDLSKKEFPEKLAKFLNEETILLIFSRSRKNQNKIDGFHNNILIDQNIACCLEKTPVKKCLYFSSISVYGEAATNSAITENTPVDPSTLYGITKYAGEKILQVTAQKAGFPLLVLRCCKVYGPGNTDMISYGPDQFINTILKDSKLGLFGDGEEKRDYLFITDLIGIIKQLAFSEAGGTLNLASGNSFSFKEIALILRKITNKDFTEICRERVLPVIHQSFVIKKLLEACPGVKFTDLEKGLQETWSLVSKQVSHNEY